MIPPSDSAKPVIGIVGGVGAGKSTVAEEFVRLGCVRIDADVVGHELLTQDDVRQEIRTRWGEAVFDEAGQVDRPALARIVFDRDADLAALNEIMHPRIGVALARRVPRALAEADATGVVLDAAVLLEAGWDRLCTALVYVDTPADVRAQRVRAQRGWDEAQWRAREKKQNSLDTKAARCEYTVDNSSGVSHLRKQVRRIFSLLTRPANLTP